MKIFTTKAQLQDELLSLKNQRKTIGFVPTMGALHEGHLSLLDYANQQNDVSVVSIFVNPTQFNNPDDFLKYPITLDNDIQMLEQRNCSILFNPEVSEMYPEKDTRLFDFGQLETVMEGKFRPGHFNGVGQIVSKLFDIVMPHKAYFGLKDFQQLAVIKQLVRILKYDIEIVACPTRREVDGLAMSSRNMRLSKKQRSDVPVIYQTLKAASHFAGIVPVNVLQKMVTERINRVEELEVEYFELVDENTLIQPADWANHKKLIACIAVFCADVRLIDNMEFEIV